jgi:autotransporter-associated beta strand protein
MGVFGIFGIMAMLGMMSQTVSAAGTTNTNTATSSFDWTNSANWSGAAYPGSTNYTLFNDTSLAYFSSITNLTITLNNNLNIQSITFGTNAVSNTIAGSGTLFLTSGGTISNANTNTNSGTAITNYINNNLSFVGGSGTYTFNSANNNNGTALVINGGITSGNTGTTTNTMVVGGAGSNLKIVFGGNIVDSASNMINLIASTGGNSPSSTSGTNSSATGLYFTGNNSLNSLQVGGYAGGSVYAIFTGSNTVRNAVNILQGINTNNSALVVSGANGYLSNSANNINVGPNAMLVYDNGGTSVTNRFGSSTVTLNGGRLIVTATNTSGTSSANVKQVNLGSNVTSFLNSTGVVATSGVNNSLTIGGITQSLPFSTLQTALTGATNVGGRVIITSAPTLTGGILPWAVDTVSGSFLSYTNLNGTNFLGGFGQVNGAYVSTTTATSNDNAAAVTGSISGAKTFNSLAIGNGQNLNVGGGTLTLTSGGLLFSNNNTASITNGALTVGSGNTLFLWDIGAALVKTLGLGIQDNGSAVSVVKAGQGSTFLTGTNTYTGNTYIQSGSLTVTNNGLLGGGNYVGSIIMTTNNALTFGQAGSQTLSGQLTGIGALTQSGTGTTTLNTNNNYTGPTTVSGGMLTLAVSNAITGSAITVAGGTLNVAASQALTNNISNLSMSGGTILFGTAGTTNNVYGINSINASSNSTATLLVTNGAVVSSTNAFYFGSAMKTNSTNAILIGGAGSTYIIAAPSYAMGGGVNSTIGTNVLNLISNNGGNFSMLGSWWSKGGSFYTNAFVQTAGSSTFTTGDLLLGQGGLNVANMLIFGGGSVTFNNKSVVMGGFTASTATNTNNLNLMSNGAANVTLAGIGFGNTSATNTVGGNITNQVILGTGVAGQGTTTLNAISNSYTAGFTGYTNQVIWNGGVLRAGAATGANFFNNLSNTLVTISNAGGIFDIAGYANTIAANLTNNNGVGALTVTNSSNTAAILTLSGSNSFNGLNVSSATASVTAGNTNALGLGAFTLNAGTLNLGALIFTNNLGTVTGGTLTNGTITNDGGTYTFANNSASTVTVAAVLAGSNGLTQSGNGTTILTGANTYSGGTVISAGTLQVGTGSGSNGLVGLGTVTVNKGGILALSQGGTGSAYNFNNVITGGGSVVLSGATNVPSSSRTLTLAASNDFSGGLTLNAGLFAANNSYGFGSGTIIANGGEIQAGSASIVITNAIQINNGGFLLDNNNSRTITLSGPISGVGSLSVVFDGGVNTILSGTNSYTGDTVIGTTNAPYYYNNTASKAQLALGSSSALTNGAALIFGNSFNGTNNTLFSLSGYNATVGSVTGSTNATLQNGAAGSSTLTVALNNTNATFGGNMNNGTGTLSLIVSGTGTQTLSGSNNFTGGTALNGGVLNLANTNAISSSTVSLNGGSLTFDSAVTGNSFTLGGIIGSGNLGMTNTTNGAISLSVGNNNASSTYSGNLSDSGLGSSLIKVGTGTLTLSGSNNYAGGTTLGGGALSIGNQNALGTGSVTVSAGSTLSTLSSMNLGNNIAVTSGILTLNNGGNSLIGSGSISGVGAVTFAGAGTTTLTTSNSYTGVTTINSGSTVLVTASGGMSSASGNSFVTNMNGTLVFDGNISNTVNGFGTNTTGGINAASGSTATLMVTNGAWVSNNTTLHFAQSGANNSTNQIIIATNSTFINSGAGRWVQGVGNNSLVLLGNYGGTFTSPGFTWGRALNASGGSNTTVQFAQTGGTSTFTSAMNFGAFGKDNMNYLFDISGGSVSVATSFDMGNSYDSGTSLSNTLIRLSNGAANFTTPSIRFGGNSYATNTFSGNITNQVVLGNGSLGKGTTTVNSFTNTYSASFTSTPGAYTNQIIWNGGVLQAGTNTGATFLSNLSNTLVTVSNTGGLFDANGFTNTIAANIGGQGTLTVTNSKATGVTTLSGSNSNVGGLNLAGGSIVLSGSNVVGNGGTIAFSGGTLRYTTNAATTDYSGRFSTAANQAYSFDTAGTNATLAGNLTSAGGTLALTNSTVGNGTITLTGANTYSGTTTVSSGSTLQVSSAGTLGSGVVALNGSLLLGSSANMTLGAISGSGVFTKGGSGTTTLSGDNSGFTSIMNVNAGTLLVNGTSGNITVNGGILGGTGGSGGVGTVTLGASGAITSGGPTGNSSGTLSVSSLILNAGTYFWNYQGTANDLILASSKIDFTALTPTAQLTLSAVTNGTSAAWPSANTNFTIMTANGGFNGFDSTKFDFTSFNNLSGNVGIWSIGTNGNDLVMTYVGGELYSLIAPTGNVVSQSGNTNAVTGSLSSVSLSGGGEYILDLTNNYSGITTIAAGTLTANGTNSFGQSATIQIGTTTSGGAAATLNINTAGASVTNAISVVGNGLNTITGTNTGTVNYTGSVNLTTNVTLASVAGGNVIFSGNLFGDGAATVSGSGTVSLLASNSYTSTTLNGGTLAISNNSALGAGTLGVSSNATLQALTAIVNTNRATVAPNATLTLDANGNAFTNSGGISGQGSMLARASAGGGTLTLAGSNSYAGASTVNAGTLALGSSNALPTSNAVTVSGTGTLDVSGYNASVRTLSDGGVSTGVITNSGGASTLTVNGSSAASSFAGTIAGALGLTKSGTGTLTLAGNNTFTGGVNLTAGQLNINNANALGSGTFTLASGVAFDNTSGSDLTITNNLTQSNLASFTYVGSGNMTLTDGGTQINLGNNATYTIASNNLTLSTLLGGSSSFIKAGNGTLTLANTSGSGWQGNGTITAGKVMAGATSQTNSLGPVAIWTLNGGALDIGGYNNQIGALSGNGGVVTNSGAAATLNLLGGNKGGSYGGVIAGSNLSLSVGAGSSSGSQTLTGVNTFSGTTTIYNGSLVIANGGSIANSAITVGNSATTTSGVLTNYGTVSNVTVGISSGNGNGLVNPNFINSNGVIQGQLTILPKAGGGSTWFYAGVNTAGSARFDNGTTASNVVVGGQLIISGNGAMNVSGVTGLYNDTITNAGALVGGQGLITVNSTYTNGGAGNTITMASSNNAFSGFTIQTNSFITLSQSGSSTTSFGVFGYNPVNSVFSTNSAVTLNGGTWNLGILGQGNTGGFNLSTNNITGGAVVNVVANSLYASGIWNINSGSLNFTQNNSVYAGKGITSSQLVFNVNGSGSLSTANNLTLGNQNVGAITAPFASALNVNGGKATIGAILTLGQNVATSGETNQVTVTNGGSLQLTSANNFVLGGTSIATNQVNTVTLGSGTISGSGAITTGTGVGINQTNSFVWTGGVLSMGTITASNAPGAGWANAAAGSAISNNTLYNTNAGLFAPGTIGIAGKAIITGNYVQSGNGALALDLLGTNMAAQFQQLVNPNTFYDTISVTGSANLGGDLVVNLGGSTPATNAAFTVMQATGGLTNNLNGAHIVSLGANNGVIASDGFGILTLRTNATSLILTNYVLNQYSGSGNWGTGGTNSWTAVVDPNSAVLGAYFGTNGNGSVTLDQNRTVSSLVMSNAAGSSLASSGGAVLSVTNNPGATTNASMTLARGNGTVSAGLALQSGLAVADTAAASSMLTLSGNITGGGGLTIASNNIGTVLLSGTNSYTGSTLVNGGALWLSGTNALAYVSSMGSSNLSVASNATLIFAMGGGNAFTTNQVASALSGGSFQAGSGLGYDVSGTNFSVGSMAGSPITSLGVYGSGTANLSNNNSSLSGLVIAASKVNVSGSSSALGGNGAVDTITGNRDITLDLGGTTQSLGGLRNTATSGVLTLQNGGLNFTNGVINPNRDNIVFGSLNQASNFSIVGDNQNGSGSLTIAFLNKQYNNGTVALGGSSVLAGSNSGISFYVGGGSLALENNYALAGQGDNGRLVFQANGAITSSNGFTNLTARSIIFSPTDTMSFGGNLDMGSATVTLNGASQTLNVTNGTLTLTNGIASAGSMTKTGAGTLILGGANNSITTTLNGGTILSLGANSLGANLVLANGLLDLGGYTDTFGTVAFNGSGFQITNGSFEVTSGYTASNGTVGISLGGAAGFTAVAGTNYLTGNNTFSGLTVASNGATLWSTYNNSTAGFIATNAGSTIVAKGYGADAWTPSQISTNIVLDNGAALAIDATGTNYLMSSPLTNGVNFTLGTFGTGTVTLADSTTNYGGVSKIALSSGTLDLGGVNATSQMTLTNVTISGGTITNGVLSTTNLVFSSNAMATIAANLVGTSGLNINGGNITLAASNSYTGSSTLSGGTLNIVASGALTTNFLVAGNGSVLNFGTANTTNIFGMNNPTGTNYTIYVTNGAVVNDTGGTYFAAPANSTNRLIIASGGVFSNSSSDKMMVGGTPASNSLSLISNNNGTLYSPGWQVTRSVGSGGTGMYVQTGDQAFFNTPGDIVFLAGNTNQTNSNVNNQFLIAGGRFNARNINIGNGNSNYASTNMYNLISNGAAQFTLSGGINFGNNQSNTVGMTNVVVMGDGTLGNGTMTLNSFINGFKTSSGYTNQIIWNGGTLRAGANTGSTFLSFMTNTLVTITNVGGYFDANGLTNTIGANLNGAGTLTITNSSANAARVTLSGTNPAGLSISEGTGVINMVFSGVETLSNSNNYSGGTTLGGGVLSIGNANALGTGTISVTGGTLSALSTLNLTNNVAVTSGALTLSNAASIALTESGTISGAGALNLIGAGTTTLASSNSYSGNTTNSAGTLNITAAGALGTNLTTISGGTLFIDTPGAANVLTGGFYLQAASGTTATIVINNGTVTVGSAFYIDSSTSVNKTNAIVINSGGTLINTIGSNTRFGQYNNGNSLNLISNNGGIFQSVGFYWGRSLSGGNNGANTNMFIQTAGSSTFTGGSAIGNGGFNTTHLYIVNGGSVNYGANGIQLGAGGAANVATNVLSVMSNGGGNLTLNNLAFGASTASNSFAGNLTNQVVLGNGTLGQGTTTLNAISNSYAATFSAVAGGYTNQLTWNGGVLKAGTNTGATFFTNLSNTLVTISNAGGLFDVAGFNNTIAANLTGTGALIVTNTGGAGTLTLSGSNSYAGGTAINAGTLAFNSQSALSTGGLTNNATLAYTGSGAQTLSNFVVSGTGSFVSAGTGTLTLTGNNSFGGAFTVSTGVLGFATSSALGTTGNITNNGTLLFSGADAQTLANNISGTGTLSVNSGSLTATGSLNGSITVTNATLIQGSTGTFLNTNAAAPVLTVNNGGNVILSGSNSMVVPGSVTVAAIQVNSGGSLSFASANALTPSLSSYNPGGTNYGTGASRVIVLGVTGGTAYFTNNGVTNTLNGGTSIASLSGGSATNINVNENILLTGTGNGATNLIISNGATLVQNAPAGNSGSSLALQSNAIMLIGSNGTYVNNNSNNGILISGGTLQIGAGGLITNTTSSGGISVGLANTSSFITNAGTISGNAQILFTAGTNQFDSTGVLNLFGANFRGNGGVNTINLLSNSTTYTGFNLNGGTNVVHIFGGATNYALPNIGYSSTGASNLVVVDAGAMVTNTNSGSLFVGQNSTSSTNTLSNNGTIYSTNVWLNGQAGSSNVNTIYQAGGSFTINSLGFQYGNNGLGSSNTSLVDITGGTMTVNGTTTIGAAGTNNVNTLQVDAGNANLATVTMGSATNTNSSRNTNRVLLNGGTLSATQFQVGAGSAAAGDSNSIVFNGGTLKAASGASTNFLASNVASVTLNLGGGTIDSSANAITIGASIDGTGGLTKVGAGTLILSASNSYAGGSTVNGGVLVMSNANALGSTNGSLNIASGTLNIGTNNSTFSTVSFGNGALTGTGTLTATGGYTATNTTALTLSSGLAGAGGFAQNGVGTTTLTGNNSYTGGTFVNAGSLVAGSASALGSSAISLSGGGAFNYSGGSATLANDITVTSGTGIIRNSGGGVLNLTGTLTKQGSVLAFYGGSYNVTGTITGTSPGNAFNSDLVLSNAAVTLGRSANFYGPTALLAGSTLTAGVANALPTNTILTMGGVGEGVSLTNSYNLNGNSQTLGGLTNAGNGVNRIYNNSGTQSLLTLAGSSTFGGSINGNIALTVSGGSSVNLSGISDYIGATTIKDSSSLNLGTTGSLNHTSNVIVSAGSTFLLGASSKVNASAGLELNNGTISMGGNGSTRAGYQAFSTLTLTGNSVIDFANLSGNSTLSFNSITINNGSRLSIYNWSGNPIYGDASPNHPGTFTQLLSSTGLSQSNLNNISFYSGSGTGFLGNGFWNSGEIVPVPEPAVVIVACMLLGWLLMANRGTLLALVRRRS